MKIRFNFLIIFFPLLCFGQLKTDFIKYLTEKKLIQEHFFYLQNLQNSIPNNDTLQVEWLKFYLLKNDYKQFENLYFKNINNNLLKKDSCILLTASILVLKQNPNQIKNWFNQEDLQNKSSKINFLIHMYNLTENISNFSIKNQNFIPDNLNFYFIEYQKFNSKKPIVSALLSTIIPGSGKLYNGRKKGFLPSFLMNATLGAFAFEAIHQNGIQKPYSIFTLGMFSMFYFSNIYGSYHETKVVIQEKKEELLYNVSDYYNTPCLYR